MCQNSISDGQEDGRNRGVFLYSDQRSTADGGAANMYMLGRDGAVRGQPKEGSKVSAKGVDIAVTDQWDENQRRWM